MNKILAILTLSFAILNADPISVNSPLSQLNNYKFQTPTSHEIKIPKETNLVIIASEKDTGALVNEYLKTKDIYYLQKNHAIYIANLHAMPSIIRKIFAIPKLQKYKHLIYLQYDEEFQNNTPNKEEKITLLRFENGKISDISFITTEAQLQAAIEK